MSHTDHIISHFNAVAARPGRRTFSTAGSPEISEIIHSGIRASSLRQRVVANNIANLNTPGYRTKAVAFESALEKAIKSGRPEDVARLDPTVFEPRNTAVDQTGNDVEIETEMGRMVSSAAMAKTYLRLLKTLYGQMLGASQVG